MIACKAVNEFMEKCFLVLSCLFCRTVQLFRKPMGNSNGCLCILHTMIIISCYYKLCQIFRTTPRVASTSSPSKRRNRPTLDDVEFAALQRPLYIAREFVMRFNFCTKFGQLHDLTIVKLLLWIYPRLTYTDHVLF